MSEFVLISFPSHPQQPFYIFMNCKRSHNTQQLSRVCVKSSTINFSCLRQMMWMNAYGMRQKRLSKLFHGMSFVLFGFEKGFKIPSQQDHPPYNSKQRWICCYVKSFKLNTKKHDKSELIFFPHTIIIPKRKFIPKESRFEQKDRKYWGKKQS